MGLTADRNTQMKDGELIALPMAAVKIFAGSLVAANASGYATPGAAAATLTYLGRAEETVDNSAGNAGDKTVQVRRGKMFKWGNYASDAVTQAELGKPCFIYDDAQVAKTSNNGARSVAGIVLGVESDGVWVAEAAHKGALAAEADLTGELTGTANGSLADIAATAGACAGGATPTADQVDTAIATAVASIVTGVNEQNKELQTKINSLLAKLRTVGVITA